MKKQIFSILVLACAYSSTVKATNNLVFKVPEKCKGEGSPSIQYTVKFEGYLGRTLLSRHKKSLKRAEAGADYDYYIPLSELDPVCSIVKIVPAHARDEHHIPPTVTFSGGCWAEFDLYTILKANTGIDIYSESGMGDSHLDFDIPVDCNFSGKGKELVCKESPHGLEARRSKKEAHNEELKELVPARRYCAQRYGEDYLDQR